MRPRKQEPASLQDLILQMISSRADIQQRDAYGRTALHRAAFHGNVDAVEVLLKQSDRRLLDARDFNGVHASTKAVDLHIRQMILSATAALGPGIGK